MTAKQVARRRVKLSLGFLLLCMYFLGGLFIPDFACASEESELFLARGNKLYLDGKYSEAKDNLVRAASLDPNNADIWAQLGTTSLQLEEFAAAKEAFTKALALDPNYPQAKLYLGVADYYLGNYPEADRLLNEAKTAAPKEGLAHYYLGLVAVKQGRPQDALTNLELGMNVSPQFALGFKGYQAASQAVKPETRPFFISLTSGIEYDDNVKVLPNQTTTSNIGPNGHNFGQYKGHKADWRTPLILTAGYEPVRTEQWTVGLRYYSYAGLNYYLDNFNVTDQLGELYVKYQLNRLTINPFYTFDYTWVGGQPWSMFNSVGLRLTLAETANLAGDLIYMWQNRDFKNTLYDFNYDRTGTLNQVGFFQTLAGKLGTLRAGFIWERELTNGINFTANRYRLPLEGYLNLPWKILAYGYFEYARTACNNRDSFANTLRRDDYFQVVVQLRRPVTSWMDMIAGFTHISNPSNIQDYQYNRNIYQLLAMFHY
jgi:tetratricopeptide (TPR) repeat protein